MESSCGFTLVPAIQDSVGLQQRVLNVRSLQLKQEIPKCLAEGMKFDDGIRELRPRQQPWGRKKHDRTYRSSTKTSNARRLLDSVDQRVTVSWDAVLTAYAPGRHLQEARPRPGSFTYLGMLKACAGPEALADGRFLQASISKAGLDTDSVLGPALVAMYVRCGSVAESEVLLQHLCERKLVFLWNVVGWNSVITAYAQTRNCSSAFRVSYMMQLEGKMPDEITLVNLLRCCQSLRQGELVGARVKAQGYQGNSIIRNAMVTMYANFSRLTEARHVFDDVTSRSARTVVSWNSMIGAYSENGCYNEALELFSTMLLEGFKPDRVTFLNVLNGFHQPGTARFIQACVHEAFSSRNDVVLLTAVLNMLGKLGYLADARALLDTVETRNAVSWNAMIAAYGQHGCYEEVVACFRLMQLEGIKPSHGTFVSVLGSLGDQGSKVLVEAKLVHSCLSEAGFETDLVVGNALLYLYGNCGCLEEARDIFHDRMRRHNVISWTTMVYIYGQQEHWDEAVHYFNFMQLEGVRPNKVTVAAALGAVYTAEAGRRIHDMIMELGVETDVVVASSLVAMYARSWHLQEAGVIFQKVKQPDMPLLNAMILAYSDHGEFDKAIQTYCRMLQAGIAANKFTIVAVLGCCADSSRLAVGRRVHSIAAEAGSDRCLVVGTGVINMYGNCGSLDEAAKVFNEMLVRDTVTWNTLIGAYAQHGRVQETLDLLQFMQLEGCSPDDVTFVAILAACSHSHLIDEAQSSLHSMVRDYGVAATVKHYGCIVDLLGRRGMVADAEELLLKMPLKPSESEWMALLSACNMHSDRETGERVARQVLMLDPGNQAACVLLSRIYAAAN